MADSNNRKTDALARVLALVEERVSSDQAGLIREFISQYYSGSAVEDLDEIDSSDLYGAALAHWGFLQHHAPGEDKVRVYNPVLDEHGWQSTHTIVEVVCDDMPFLVDSVRMDLDRSDLTVHLLIHPVMRVLRDEQGNAQQILASTSHAAEARVEAVMHFEVDRQTSAQALAKIEADVRLVLTQVHLAVEDWPKLRQQLHDIIQELADAPPPLPADEVREAREFLSWVEDNHFTFLGYVDYDLLDENDSLQLVVNNHSGLGILRGDTGASQGFARLAPEIQQLAQLPELLILTKANHRSPVHRPGYMDYIGIKRIDDNGKVVGERRFIGLYTSAAYNRVPRDIPLLSGKVQRLLDRAGYPPNSHAAKAIMNILDNFPRDELLQLSEEELYATATGIMHLQERRQIRLFIHQERFARFYSCLVYLPRERFNTDNRRAIQAILEEALGAHESEFNVRLTDSVLARLYFLMRMPVAADRDIDIRALEQAFRDATRNWADDLREAILEHFGEARGARLVQQYGSAFRADYRENYSPRVAVLDVERMEGLEGDGGRLAMSLYKPLEAEASVLHFKLFHVGRSVSLSYALPILENMGLRVDNENPSKIKRVDGQRVWVHDFGLLLEADLNLNLEHVRPLFQEAFEKIFFGEVENDGFNKLVITAELGWRDILILRAYCKYLRQLGFTFSQTYMEKALAANPDIARQLIQLFHLRLDPDWQGDRDSAGEALYLEIREALENVTNLDEDRIIRAYLSLIRATLRTNHYQQGADGGCKDYLSLKLDPAGIPEMPKPKPMYEIAVYSPRMEGVHLRGGPVARGGIRWSDRREDFRTEILGLVKAQMVKNAVIVPVGSKGGFYPKHLPQGDREAILKEGIACYQTLMRGLLDLTDNYAEGGVVHPPRVVRHDGDDPYLVVAADKGTATFSDIANDISNEYGFWLGDAFASGGSAGYDHKDMGITARGAWESVKRHFRELGTDIQSEDFTVVGIGDMAGDVFGNGMLLSEHIRLLGAFNHLHIFIDPDAEAASSFAERKRLFELPRSSWSDYAPELISAGGGVFSRSLKSIAITPQMRTAFKLDKEVDSLTPTALINAMLKAPVDLLWNGGIGTYAKASSERHAEVGDRANDNLRVNGSELRCRVVGEGGNLGFTQLARIEYAFTGGQICTDAIDNSAGVDCSDHEVNIKILVDGIVRNGDLTHKQRNTLLSEMTDEIGHLVLRDNYLQTQALSMAHSQAASMFDVHARLIRHMERNGELERAIEYLPAEDEILERRNQSGGLTLPELSVLIAYVKIGLFKELLEADLARDPFLDDTLVTYFPTPLRERYVSEIPKHRLAGEIISTVVANEVVNRAGLTYCFRLQEETGAQAADIARAYVISREIYAMASLWQDIENLDGKAAAAGQVRALLEARKLCERSARWLLRNRPRPLDISSAVQDYAEGIAALAGHLPKLAAEAGTGEAHALEKKLSKDGIPKQLAQRISWFGELNSSLDIVSIARDQDLDVVEVAQVYFALGKTMQLHWLRERIVALPRGNRWQTLARSALRDDLYTQERLLTARVLEHPAQAKQARARVDAWVKANRPAVDRCRQVLGDLQSSGQPDFAMLSVAMGEIRALQG